MSRRHAQDPLVVSTEALARVVERFMVSFEADHPIRHDSGPNDSTGAYQYLATRSGTTERGLRRILYRETKFTTFDFADRLVSGAIGRPDLMPEVVPNPLWSRGKWEQWRQENGGCDVE